MVRISRTDGLAVLCLLAAMVGCSDGRPERVPVSGQVLLDGKPLPSGSIRVLPHGGRSAFGQIGPDGRFTLATYDYKHPDGCLLGTHPVEVVATGAPTHGEFEPGGGNGDPHWLIPKRYSDYRTSGLTLTVDQPTDAALIELKSK